MQHKGFSSAVLTVFLFLLALLFIGVLGGFLLEAVSKGEASLNAAAACAFVQMAPVSCIYTSTANGTYNLHIQARRQGTTTPVKELHVLLTKADTQDVVRISASTIPRAVETIEILALQGLSSHTYTHVALAPTLEQIQGNFTCTTGRTIECIESSTMLKDKSP